MHFLFGTERQLKSLTLNVRCLSVADSQMLSQPEYEYVGADMSYYNLLTECFQSS